MFFFFLTVRRSNAGKTFDDLPRFQQPQPQEEEQDDHDDDDNATPPLIEQEVDPLGAAKR